MSEAVSLIPYEVNDSFVENWTFDLIVDASVECATVILPNVACGKAKLILLGAELAAYVVAVLSIRQKEMQTKLDKIL